MLLLGDDAWRLRVQSVLLLLLLAASGALTWESYAEHMSFAEHARRAAQQTAIEAAGSLVRLVQAVELGSLLRAMAPITGRVEDDTPAARERLAQRATHPATAQWCSMYDLPCERGPGRYVFHMDLRTHTWTATAPVDSVLRRWIRDSVTYEATHEYRQGWQLAALDTRIGTVPHVVVYRVSFDENGAPVVANGLEIDIPLAARQAFAHAFAHTPLLTTPVTQGVPNDSLFVVRVIGAQGNALFRSGTGAPTAEYVSVAGDPTWEFGPYVVRLSLTPRLRRALDAAAGRPRAVTTTYLLFLFCAGLICLALVQARREYALAHVRETFIGNVSHELRTPLAQIRLHAEALQFGFIRDDAARTNALGIIVEEAVRLKHLVDNVLTYNREGDGPLVVSVMPVDVREVLESVASRLEPLATRGGVALQIQIDDAPVAAANRSALEQVVANFVDNAVRYATGTERVVLSARQSDGIVSIAVADFGPGILPGDRNRIWERFVRLDTAADVAGTGIGLAIVASLVAAMRGRVFVTDTAPRGATFVVELAAAPA